MNKISLHTPVTAEQIYHDFKDRIRQYIQSRIGHPQDAEDLLSSIFLKVHQSLPTYNPAKAGLSTWVYAITRNTINDYLRRQYRTPDFDSEDALLDCAEKDLPLLDKVILEEQLEVLGAALEKLPEREREIILLRFYYQRTSLEVAGLMKLSHENVRYLQHIAVGKLKKIMETQR